MRAFIQTSTDLLLANTGYISSKPTAGPTEYTMDEVVCSAIVVLGHTTKMPACKVAWPNRAQCCNLPRMHVGKKLTTFTYICSINVQTIEQWLGYVMGLTSPLLDLHTSTLSSFPLALAWQ
jgi:hypothetical protein